MKVVSVEKVVLVAYYVETDQQEWSECRRSESGNWERRMSDSWEAWENADLETAFQEYQSSNRDTAEGILKRAIEGLTRPGEIIQALRRPSNDLLVNSELQNGDEKMSQVMFVLSDDHPLVIAWNLYKSSEAFKNSLKWASVKEHSEGSLWAAFVAGHQAGTKPLKALEDGVYYLEHIGDSYVRLTRRENP